eukprot:TRINITY_DN6853_c0_g1_i1.p1 TRINITY_DN6853_c0_g1~~TRINITY_DN6853_c0_g1_i1.p1  ORF type:complete len:381 (-),score=51.85 TRINITY_DN6853_c0_g1_i1:120-1262(-)
MSAIDDELLAFLTSKRPSERTFVLLVEADLTNLLVSTDKQVMVFPSPFTSWQRLVVHRVAQCFCMCSKSAGSARDRRVVVKKTQLARSPATPLSEWSPSSSNVSAPQPTPPTPSPTQPSQPSRTRRVRPERAVYVPRHRRAPVVAAAPSNAPAATCAANATAPDTPTVSGTTPTTPPSVDISTTTEAPDPINAFAASEGGVGAAANGGSGDSDDNDAVAMSSSKQYEGVETQPLQWTAQDTLDLFGSDDLSVLPHVLEISGFSISATTSDLEDALDTAGYRRKYRLQWVDDLHALVIFANEADAHVAMHVFEENDESNLTLNSLKVACTASREKAHMADSRPYSIRPETSTKLATRLIHGALGVRASSPKRATAAAKDTR